MKTIYLSFVAVLFSCCSLQAMSEPNAPSIFDHWANANKMTEVTLSLDFGELEEKRMTPEKMTATLNDGTNEYALKVNVRGRFRRRTCSMPPLKLRFDKKWLAQAGFNNHNDFKLVTHCTDDAAGQENILREQLAYELYRQIAPEASYRTQVLKVNYIDTRDGSTQTSYAILIEDTDELKDRINGKSAKNIFGISSGQINNEAQITLFNYMIGNADFSFKMGRNLKFIKQEGDQDFTTVPYDFDFSALVSAKYAGHSGKTDSPREMIWEFNQDPNFASARGQFLFLKEDLLNTIDNFTLLSNKSRKHIHRYVASFFTQLENDQLAR